MKGERMKIEAIVIQHRSAIASGPSVSLSSRHSSFSAAQKAAEKGQQQLMAMRAMGISYHALPYPTLEAAKAAAPARLAELDQRIAGAKNMSDEHQDAIKLYSSLSYLDT
jgi:hypothetical protein